MYVHLYRLEFLSRKYGLFAILSFLQKIAFLLTSEMMIIIFFKSLKFYLSLRKMKA